MKTAFEIAQAIARDAGNKNMKREGRTSWNRADYDIMVETLNAMRLPIDEKVVVAKIKPAQDVEQGEK